MTSINTTQPTRPPLMIEQIKQKIRARIGSTWRIGDRLPPIIELARDLKVGEKNAYLAVRSLAEEGVLASRPRQGTFVADRPSKSKARDRKRHVIHMALDPDRDGLIHRMGHAFIEEMRRREREVRLVRYLPDSDGMLDLRGVDADAVVLFNATHHRVLIDQPGPIISLMDTSGKPPSNITRRYDLVGPDNEQGGILAGEFMRAFDISDVAFVGVGNRETGQYNELDSIRLAGFERGFGKQVPQERRFFVDFYSQHEGASFARRYMDFKSRPQALFMSTDDIAAGFTVGGAILGLENRRDYLLLGFDGQSLAKSGVFGGITTVAVPAEAMGRQAAEFLDMRLEQPDLPPRKISLGCSIHRGKTSPRVTEPHHPFWKDQTYWPAPLGEGETS